MDEQTNMEKSDDTFWRRAFFSEQAPVRPLRRTKNDLTAKRAEKIGNDGELWLSQLFEGKHLSLAVGDRLIVYKEGVVVHEILLSQLGRETVIGRHPDADLQLESYKLAMFHAVILENEGKYYIENLDHDCGILIQRKKIKLKTVVQLRDGMQIDLPSYRLEFVLANTPALDEVVGVNADDLEDVPAFFYTPPPPTASPLLANLVDDQAQLSVWTEGLIQLVVVDIIDETHDCKTFRFAGKEPILFSYKPGQFITFILNIAGIDVKRSYSMSSSPSRPHLLEVTIKRVPGGLVSNWFCDQTKLGDELTVKGPFGKFTCFNFPSTKMLFIGAGSGMTPILSMSRWITDMASDVDIKLLGSFKTPTDIVFRKELEMLSARNTNFQIAITVTAGWQGTDFWTGFTGRISQEMLGVFAPDILDRDIFMCGPEPFTENIKNILHEIGYEMSRFHTESFGSGRSAQDSRSVEKALELKGTQHKVTFKKSGLVVNTDEHVNLLTLAEAHGIEVDYSCRAGSCGECEVKCQGKVTMSDDCEINDKTKAAGFIYVCCCTAKTDLELEV
ncbi:MAG: FHA domain-containing protein [Methylococcales bacterium]|nr:FHA domain-containing protein [Methylococcales bacterium]